MHSKLQAKNQALNAIITIIAASNRLRVILSEQQPILRAFITCLFQLCKVIDVSTVLGLAENSFAF